MFFRKLKRQNAEMAFRIRELEERLCPCQQHQWKMIGSTIDYDGDSINQYQCARCGKVVKTYKYLD